MKKVLEREKKRNEKWIADWQQILRLQDWKITHEVVHGWDRLEAQAEISWDEDMRDAHIKILSDASQWRDRDNKLHQEWTIVHELLHLYTRPLAPKMDHESEEWLINSLSKLLLDFRNAAKATRRVKREKK